MSGKHLTGTVIYGYLWDEKREHWLVDEEAGVVLCQEKVQVKRELFLDIVPGTDRPRLWTLPECIPDGKGIVRTPSGDSRSLEKLCGTAVGIHGVYWKNL